MFELFSIFRKPPLIYGHSLPGTAAITAIVLMDDDPKQCKFRRRDTLKKERRYGQCSA
jgi:hypothetical protein